jgi:hypothetical protein
MTPKQQEECKRALKGGALRDTSLNHAKQLSNKRRLRRVVESVNGGEGPEAKGLVDLL